MLFTSFIMKDAIGQVKKADLKGESHYGWTNNAWQPIDSMTYIYDEKDRMISEMRMLANEESGKLEVEYRITNTYDEKGNIIVELREIINFNTKEYMVDVRNTFTYDEKNRKATGLHEEWKNHILSYIEGHKETYQYDEKDNLISLHVIAKEYEKETYMDSQLTTWTYDSNKNIVTKTEQNGRDLGNSVKWNYEYDAKNNNIAEYFFEWLDESKEYDKAASFKRTYDAQNNLLTGTISTNYGYYGNSKYENKYNSKNQIIEALDLEKDPETGKFSNSRWTKYYYR